MHNVKEDAWAIFPLKKYTGIFWCCKPYFIYWRVDAISDTFGYFIEFYFYVELNPSPQNRNGIFLWSF